MAHGVAVVDAEIGLDGSAGWWYVWEGVRVREAVGVIVGDSCGGHKSSGTIGEPEPKHMALPFTNTPQIPKAPFTSIDLKGKLGICTTGEPQQKTVPLTSMPQATPNPTEMYLTRPCGNEGGYLVGDVDEPQHTIAPESRRAHDADLMDYCTTDVSGSGG